MFLNDAHLISIGIDQMGPRFIILSVVEKLQKLREKVVNDSVPNESMHSSTLASTSTGMSSEPGPSKLAERNVSKTEKVNKLIIIDFKYIICLSYPS